MPGGQAVDLQALSAYLSQHLDGFKGPLTAEIFKGGQSNPTYKLITPSASYVMRSKPGPVARLLPSAHAIERRTRRPHQGHGRTVRDFEVHALQHPRLSGDVTVAHGPHAQGHWGRSST